ncbi:MAG TPA: MFS transporter [Ktedonosporobacter sp.]|jgi:fucose permease|nr:MFS transporter [Ktedonosporobacter sp.]
MRPKFSPFLRSPVLLACFGFALIGINGGANGVLLPSLSAFYHVGDATIGLLFLVSSLGYFLSALGSGFLTERLGLRWPLLLGTFTLLLGLLAFGLKLPFVLLLAARLLLGFGIGIIETGFNVYTVTLPRHAVLLNYLHAFYGVGALVGPLLASSILAGPWEWNSVYLVMAIIWLPLLPGIGVLFNSVRLDTREQEGKESGSGNVLGATLRLPIAWLAALFLLIYVGVEVSLGSWGYSFLLEVRQQGTVVAGWIVSGYWFGLTLGRFVLQPLAERFGIGIKVLMYACLAGIVIGLLLIWLLPSGIVAAAGFGFIGFSLAPIYPLTVALIPKLVPPRLGPSAIGMLVSISIIGLALFPWAAGILAQFRGIWTLLPYTLALTLMMLGLWYYLARQNVIDA